MRERSAVTPEDLRRRVDPAVLPFRTTAEVAPVQTTIGQPRTAAVAPNRGKSYQLPHGVAEGLVAVPGAQGPTGRFTPRTVRAAIEPLVERAQALTSAL